LSSLDGDRPIVVVVPPLRDTSHLVVAE